MLLSKPYNGLLNEAPSGCSSEVLIFVPDRFPSVTAPQAMLLREATLTECV